MIVLLWFIVVPNVVVNLKNIVFISAAHRIEVYFSSVPTLFIK